MIVEKEDIADVLIGCGKVLPHVAKIHLEGMKFGLLSTADIPVRRQTTGPRGKSATVAQQRVTNHRTLAVDRRHLAAPLGIKEKHYGQAN